MRLNNTIAKLFVIVLATSIKVVNGCTTIIVGKDASTNGSPHTTHTNDCSNCDFRLTKVPSFIINSSTIDIPLVKMDYPRYVGYDRGPLFHPSSTLDVQNYTQTTVIGSIPSLGNKTFAYLDGLYGIMNEAHVAIGESTCGGRLVSKPKTLGGHALLDVTILTRLAMQYTSSARQAIQLMGDLAVKYGYYGAVFNGPDALGEAGEALTVTDTTEAWVFHIHPDHTGSSAVWVAQRVLDDHVSVVANAFVIKEFNLSDTTNFMGSSNIKSVAKAAGLYKSGPFSFTKVFGLVREHGMHIYSTRRVWRVLTTFNTNLNLSAETDVYGSTYPFSTKVSFGISAKDLMEMQRDHYEGTPFDMTRGPASGPFGNPDRYDVNGNGNMNKTTASSGRFERAISIFRASYSFVTSFSDIPTLWFGQYAPHATTYVPVYVNVSSVPRTLETGSLSQYEVHSAYWRNALVGNWVSRFYNVAIPYVKHVQNALEQSALDDQANLNIDGEEEEVREYLTQKSASYENRANDAFNALFKSLVTVFHDGYVVSNLNGPDIKPVSLFYPEWWLNQVGYFTSVTRGESSSRWITTIVTAIVAASAFTIMGIFIGRHVLTRKNSHEYQPVY